ncbi:MAG: glycosyltransferase family 4 protein [Desulfobacterota bacterium]|nr:glycosyltransferase family 4 protein [Thermodesulfobacteriota bacterium]
MRVLHVVHFYPPFSIGGTEVYTRNLARTLSRSCTVEIFCTVPSGATLDTERHNGIRCTAIQKDVATFGMPFHEVNGSVETIFAETLNRFNPDIIHFHHLMNLSLRLPLIARAYKIPSCYTLHDFWLVCPRAFLLDINLRHCAEQRAQHCCTCFHQNMRLYTIAAHSPGIGSVLKQFAKKTLNGWEKLRYLFALGPWRHFYVQRIMHVIDCFIAPSRFIQQQYERFGISSSKIVFIPHGIPHPCTASTQKTVANPPRFLYIGSLHLHKGITTLIDAFNLIDTPCTLSIYGTGRPHVVENLRSRCHNNNVRFFGMLPEDEKQRVFGESDALIVPSLCYENLPLVVLEAFAARVPVIASNHGGLAEIVHDGINGCTFTAGDPQSLAAVIRRCIEHPDLLAQWSEGIQPVNDMETHAQEIAALYEALLVKSHTGKMHCFP